MRPECEQACAPYGLALPSARLGGRIGERMGHGTGSSLEFTDFRDYQPGDDVRHVDWRSYARTDQLKVRLYREEIAPVLDIVVDTSASMAVRDGKALACRDLVAAFRHWIARIGGRARVLASGGGEIGGEIDFALEDGRQTLELPLVALRPRSLRIVVSDFLVPGDPRPLAQRVAAGAARVWLVQLLDPTELDPDAAGPVTMVDCETGARADVELGERAIRGYKERLARLTAAVRTAALGCGGAFVAVRAATPAAMFRDDLLAQGMIEVSAA